ncbi:unnamed protein product [Mytilus coruscus]|uniref:CARD domain-containing protein n=1 Tax=Mytilus coruscus TaxID=42192 RepID=A0A6J8AE87_MYTCO|nr:unnamed protein product [Mytilus coruscus]
MVKNPFWQILRHWVEAIEYLHIDPSKILYKGLRKVNKILKRDLLKWMMRDSQKINIKEVKEYVKDEETFEFVQLKSRLKSFRFSDDDDIPLLIWKMGKESEEQYRKVLQSDGVEKRYVIRLPVVGPFGVGKTCLTRRLLRTELSNVSSTNGIEIMIRKCKVRVKDGTWIFSSDKRFDANQERKSRLIKNICESEASLDDFAETVLLDFAGQYEFYATHQTFLNKHAIYLLVMDVSRNLKGLMTSDDEDDNFFDLTEVPFKDIGEYINFWMDAIHCYGDEEHQSDSTKEALPSIIVVGTCCDKLQIKKKTRQCEIQEQLDKILGNHPKRKHIKDFVILSNTVSPESDFDALRQRIAELASKVETWGQQLPIRWIKYEQILDTHRDNQIKVMSYEDMHAIGESAEIDTKDINDIGLFLRYQHDIGNLIYFDEIPDIVILQPQWLGDIMKCLVSARKFQIERNVVYNSDWQELEKTGRLTEDLITQAFTGEEAGTDFLKHKRDILKIMEKFDIIVKPNIAEDESVSNPGKIGEIKTSNLSTADYYVPCLIKAKPISNIVDSFNADGQDCNRTSWICMSFDFLPPAFFNHVLVSYIRRYQISREPSKHGSRLALYRGMGVFNLDTSGQTKLAVCVYNKVILFQIWQWGKHCQMSFKNIWEHAEATIVWIKGRYKMNVSYTVAMKCCHGRHDNQDGMVDMKMLKSNEEYYCDEHAVSHNSQDLLDSWFQEQLNAEMLNYVRLAKTITDLMPEVMVEILKADGVELVVNSSIEFRSLYISFQLKSNHKPTSGIWASRISPNEDTDINIGDDVERWRFILNELKNHSKITDKLFLAHGKVLANVFIRAEKMFEKHSFFSKYQKIMTGQFDANEYEIYRQRVKTEVIPDSFEVQIKRHYERIIQEIHVRKILDEMITHCVLSIDDRRHIEQHVRQTEQNQALLDVIIEKNSSTFRVFNDVLRETGYDDIAQLLSSDPEDIILYSRTVEMEELSECTVPFKVRLQKNYVNIISTIKHEAIVDHLISCDLFTIDDQQFIEACPEQTEKNRKLIDRLWHCGEKGFLEFLNALSTDDVYVDLSNQIKHTKVF